MLSSQRDKDKQYARIMCNIVGKILTFVYRSGEEIFIVVLWLNP